VIYPISVKTLARKQYDALREMQKRIRLALEENHMLPGSPFRVIGGHGPTLPGERPNAAPTQDPTTNKPNETNPFAAQ
jgi:small conductance mechanosensitive channel